MHTNVDTNVIRNVMTQGQPVCLHVLNGCVVSDFCWYSLIHNPATNVNVCVLLFFHVGHAEKQAYSCMAANTVAPPSKPSGLVMQH